MEALTSRPTITPRNPNLTFDETIPKHWFADSVLASQMVNGVNLLFPAGERFFVRSVHYYLDKLDDPELKKEVRGFFNQEGRHAKAHEDFFERMEAQGYDIREFLRIYEKIAYELIEPNAPKWLSLSTTAALEHYTAALAHAALRYKLLDHAHPAMRELLYWHASEEIEHRAVAFDVLAKMEPGYAKRMAGYAIGSLMLGGFWVAATLMLIRQDNRRESIDWREDFQRFKTIGIRPRRIARAFGAYMKSGFHPLKMDDMDELARQWLRQKGMA